MDAFIKAVKMIKEPFYIHQQRMLNDKDVMNILRLMNALPNDDPSTSTENTESPTVPNPDPNSSSSEDKKSDPLDGQHATVPP